MAENIATTKPSGLSIVREGNKFTFGWKIPSCKYEQGQQLQWRRKIADKWESWKTISAGKAVTAKQVTVSAADFYPNTKKELHQVQFRVRGKRANEKNKTYGWSDWASKAFDVVKPKAPVVEAALSKTQSNVCTFSWKAEAGDKAKEWLTNTEWETMLVKNCTVTDVEKLKWKTSADGYASGSGSASGQKEITENTAVTGTGSHTRWFRVRSRGPEGNSAWKYAKHVYAESKRAEVKDAETKKDKSGGLGVTVTWTADANAARPIDKTEVEYKIAVPGPGLSCPSGSGWKTGDVSKDTKGKDMVHFVTEEGLQKDECLFIRINTVHDGKTTYGKPELAKNGIGQLKDPSDVSVSIDQTTFRATVTATNNSAVPDAQLAVVMRRSKKAGDDLIVGIIPAGQSSVTVQCPDWTGDPVVAFGVYAFVGNASRNSRWDGADSYTVVEGMRSKKTVWTGGNVPVAPDSISAELAETEGTVRVTWDWSWKDADAAELSWADHEDAWESTDGPNTYLVSNLYAARWNISGLATGKTWYIRVRLLKGETYGPYSEIVEADLASEPVRPMLQLSQGIVQKGKTFTAYWDYLSGDATEQAYAEIREAAVSGSEVMLGNVIARVETARHADVTCPDSWTEGQTHEICLRVVSASGKQSEWSEPAEIMVAEPVEVTVAQHSLTNVTVTADESQGLTRTVLALVEMPLSVTITGAGTAGITTAILERAEDYQVDRPDGTTLNGYEGETIAQIRQTGEGQIIIENRDLIGSLDDGAAYRLIAAVEDGLGQVDTTILEFEVHWSRKALIPKANATLRGSAIEITPIAPAGAVSTDTCDIYRLSADRPVLIAEDVAFGETYVDPYPAIGDYGGHRIVYKTANNDYITSEGVIAWLDLADEFDAEVVIIDFGGDQIVLSGNLGLSNNWKKELVRTKYLGGTIQGDWMPGVDRNTGVQSVLVTGYEEEDIAGLRRLAEYTGLCHVRTPDGSSLHADVQVSESRSYQSGGRKVDVSLTITRVDPVGLDALPIKVWRNR